MNIQDRLAQELAELEGPKANPQVDVPEARTEEKIEVVDNTVPDKVEAIEPKVEEPRKKREDWKKRAIDAERRAAGLKAKTDSLTHSTRGELEAMRAQIAQLQATPKVEVDPFDGVFSEADTDTIGIEAVDIIKRASRKASEVQIDPLKAEITRLKKEAADAKANVAKAAQVSEYDNFTAELGKQVESWGTLNSDPGFLEYLGGVNTASGYTRGDLLRRAEQGRDVDRVAGFMKDYIASVGTVDKLEAQVGPPGSPSASVARKEQVEMVMASEIDKFYDDAMRGRYKRDPALAAQLQDKYDKAIRENRVDNKR